MNAATVWRWIRKGIKDEAGQRQHLNATRKGGTWMISDQQLHDFYDRTTPQIQLSNPKPRRNQRRSRSRHQHAMAELRALGILS